MNPKGTTLGLYMISSNGRTWSHSNESENNKSNSFMIKPGEEI